MAEKMCYRCSTCAQNWPLVSAYAECPLCGEKCWTHNADKEDVPTLGQSKDIVREATEEPPHANQGLSGGELGGSEGKVPLHTSIHGNVVFEHRYGVFMRMGFGPSEAEALANTREDTHRIKKVLEQGCNLETALTIWL